MSKRAAQAAPSSRAGMTLIEVMLAVVMLGIAGIVLIHSATQGLAVVRAAYLYAQAHTLLAQVDLENPLFDEDVRIGTEQGRFRNPDKQNFDWMRRIEAVGDEDDRLFEITTRVSWTRRGQRGYEEVVYYRYVPEENGP